MSRLDMLTTEESVVDNSSTDHLHTNPFEQGRYIRVVHNDEQGFEIEVSSKTSLQAVYIKVKDDIASVTVAKFVNKKKKQEITLSRANISQLKGFLEFLTTTKLVDIASKKLALADENELNPENSEHIRRLLDKEGGGEIIKAVVDAGGITTVDIINTAFRRKQLDSFHRLLTEGDAWINYGKQFDLALNSEEAIWQHFFERNDWIFGYGLDYRFNGILQTQFHASETEADGSSSVITDFLLGDKRYTTFVEIKKPSTPLFTGTKAQRSNSWSLSSDLIHSVSQILEQKASGQLRLADGQLKDETGEPIVQRSYDSKVILVIGDWNRVESASTKERETKEKTLELFRRDSRNIKILTFDELFERANFIVEHGEKTS